MRYRSQCMSFLLILLFVGGVISAQDDEQGSSRTASEKRVEIAQAAKPTPEEKERRKNSKKRRIIVNDDGEVAGLSPGRTIEDYLGERFKDVLGTQVDSYFLCVGSTDRGPGNRPDPPRVQDSQNLWFPDKKLPASVDQLTRAYLKAAKEAGLEIFASFRMNDIHDAWAAKLTYPLKVERPDLLIGEQARKPYPKDSLMRAFWSGFDYAKDEVRQHFRDFILTYCREYEYDGVELDYFRHPLFFKLGEEAANLDRMTEFVRQVRQGLDEIGRERGRPYLLTVRVPDTAQMSLQTGLDVEQWLKEGLLDFLVVGGGYMPYASRLKELIDLAHRYGVPAYPCINHFQDPVKMRSYASNFWSLGGDGIYIFNYYGVDDGSEKAQCLKELGEPGALLGLDKHYLPDNGLSVFYCAYANPPGPFPVPGFQGSEHNVHPVRLIDGTPFELVFGDDVQQAGRQGKPAELLLQVKVGNVGPEQRIAIRINGAWLPDNGIERADDDTFKTAVTAPPLRRGVNHIVILPGKKSVGRLSSDVRGLELSVRYKRD